MKILLIILLIITPLSSIFAQGVFNEKNLIRKDIIKKSPKASEEDSSLMFDKEQSRKINNIVKLLNMDPKERKKVLSASSQEEIKEETEEKKQETIEQSFIHLGSIIYLSKQHWVIWINNEKISSDSNNQDNEIFVTSIHRGEVKILWRVSLSKWKIIKRYVASMALPQSNSEGEVEVRFTLKPNQTFSLMSESIMEGKVTPSIIAETESESPKESPDVVKGAIAKTTEKNNPLEKDADSSLQQIQQNIRNFLSR
jgi:hypothetical protein